MTVLIAATGTVSGGWSYIYAAYALVWLVLGGYAVSLLVRAGGRR